VANLNNSVCVFEGHLMKDRDNWLFWMSAS